MSQRIANPSLRIALLVISALFAGPVSAQHVELGAFVGYGRPNVPGFPENAFGAGGRVNINLHRFLQAEFETAYDVKYASFVLVASSASATLTNSRLGILHMNGGLKLQTAGGSFFLFFKGGANRYGPEQTIQTVAGTPIVVTTSTSSLPAFTEGIFYPGGGIGFHAGPLGIRVDAGDEIYWSSGTHHNFRLTFGPTIRF
ncbi:MAG TPA: hypothetical protein VJS37_07710 [Terriglobales bacterium]|nr:hypothetical protein [Terriglobales bacterium]